MQRYNHNSSFPILECCATFHQPHPNEEKSDQQITTPIRSCRPPGNTIDNSVRKSTSAHFELLIKFIASFWKLIEVSVAQGFSSVNPKSLGLTKINQLLIPLISCCGTVPQDPRKLAVSKFYVHAE
jgi:hypothetical protein